jgi:hypothetical protein
MRPGKRRALGKDSPVGAVLDQLEHIKARIRVKVEHPFRVIKRQFRQVKVRYRGLAKNTAQLHTLFALANVWMARHWLCCRGCRHECVCKWPKSHHRHENGQCKCRNCVEFASSGLRCFISWQAARCRLASNVC